MPSLFILLVLCFSLCACGGGSGSNGTQSTKTTSGSVADYQGIYVGSTAYMDSRNSGVSIQVILDIDETGLVFSRSSDATKAMIISFSRLNANGQPQGTSIVNDYLGQQLIISYTGTIDLYTGTFDITYTYSGTVSGSFRVYGTRPLIGVHVYASEGTINLGQTVILHNISLMPGSLYSLEDGGVLFNPDQFFSWSVKSAPNGSLATFVSRNTGSPYDMPFTPDKKGTYVITLTGHNGAGAPASADVTINVI